MHYWGCSNSGHDCLGAIDDIVWGRRVGLCFFGGWKFHVWEREIEVEIVLLFFATKTS